MLDVVFYLGELLYFVFYVFQVCYSICGVIGFEDVVVCNQYISIGLQDFFGVVEFYFVVYFDECFGIVDGNKVFDVLNFGNGVVDEFLFVEVGVD